MKKRIVSIVVVMMILVSYATLSFAVTTNISVGAMPMTKVAFNPSRILDTEPLLRSKYIIFQDTTTGYTFLLTSYDDLDSAITYFKSGTDLYVKFSLGVNRYAYCMAPGNNYWNSGWEIYTSVSYIQFSTQRIASGYFLVDETIANINEPCYGSYFDDNTQSNVSFHLMEPYDWSYWKLRFDSSAEIGYGEMIEKIEGVQWNVGQVNGTIATSNGFFADIAHGIADLWGEFQNWQTKVGTSIGNVIDTAFGDFISSVLFYSNAIKVAVVDFVPNLMSDIGDFFAGLFAPRSTYLQSETERTKQIVMDKIPGVVQTYALGDYFFAKIRDSARGDVLFTMPEVTEPSSNVKLWSAQSYNMSDLLHHPAINTLYLFYMGFVRVLFIFGYVMFLYKITVKILSGTGNGVQ